MATGAGLRPRAKAWDLPPDPTVHAPQLYPDKAGGHVYCCAPAAEASDLRGRSVDCKL
jgi:hypothetical protein